MVTRTHTIQTNFTAGEISPLLRGRVDIGKYKNSVREMLNFLVSPYGTAYKRPGLKYINALENQSVRSQLIPFEFSNTESYVLELNNQTMRFYRNQGLILQSRSLVNNTFDSGIAGWTDNSNGTGSIAYDAGNNRMNLVGVGAGNEAVGTSSVYVNSGINTYTVTVDVYTGDVTYKVGTTSGASDIATGTATVGVDSTFTFTNSDNSDLYISFENANSDTRAVDNIRISNEEYKIDTPYTTAELSELRVTQSSDIMYLLHKDHAPRKLSRFDNDSWDLSEVSFSEPPYLDVGIVYENGVLTAKPGVTITPSAVSGSITVTASSDIFQSTDVGRSIRYKAGPDTSDAVTYTGTGTQTNFDISFFPQTSSDIEVYKIAATGIKTLQTNPTHYSVSSGQVVMVSAPSTSEKILIQPKNAGSGEWGYMTITAYSSGTSVTATVNSAELGGTNASEDWRLGAWSETTGYPRAGVFHEQRLFLGGSIAQEQTVWGSTTGVFEDFSPDNVLNKGDIDDDTSVSFTIASTKAQTILWLSSQTALLIGTSNGVHSLSGGTNTGITPTSVKRVKETNAACEFAAQVETDNQTIFIQRLQRRVFSIGYRFEIDGYQTTDLSLLAEHIGTSSGFKEIVYQEIPDKVIWAILDDGSLVSCTYVPGQDVIGWATHTVGGSDVQVESLCVIPSTSSDEVYALVKRTINGGTKRYLEVLTDQFNQDEKEDAFFVDSGLTYSGASTSTISGLNHLEGESVTVLADGAAHAPKTVSSGSITLDLEAEKVQVGLGYDATLETNFIESGSRFGTNQGTLSRIIDVSIRFHETIGAKVGYSSALTDLISFRNSADNMDSGPSLFTGDKELQFPHGQELGYKVYLKSDQPLPCTVLAFVYKAIISDK